ncbi:hypothetical protein T492DRAFT_1109982, partial [Pavlovales sp. CCMP2436]
LFGGTAAPPSPFSVLVAGGLFDFGGAGLGGAANPFGAPAPASGGLFGSAGLCAAAGGGLLGQPAAGSGLFGPQPVAASGGFIRPGTAASGGLFGGFGGEGALSGAANPFVATDAADAVRELRVALRTEDPVQLTLAVAAVATARAERERRAAAAADGTDEGAGHALAAITGRLRNLQRTDGSSLDPATASRLELLPRAPTALDAFERHLADTSAARSSLEASTVELRRAINSADWDGCSIAELCERRDCTRAECARALSHGAASYAGDAIRREAGELREEAELLRDHLKIVRCGVQLHIEPCDKWRRDDDTAAAETCEDALRAFDYWVEATDPTRVVLATDAVVHEAWAALERLGARCGSDDACDAWQRACGMARDRLDAERAHWASTRHPWATLPLRALEVAVQLRADDCEARACAAERARERAREARAESDALAATPSGASLACVHADVEERAELAKRAQREMLEAEHALRMARIDSRDVHAAGERLRTVRQAMQGVQRALEESRAWAWQLIEGPCPELLIQIPESCKPLSNMAPELRAVLVPGRTLSHYEPIEWPSKRLEPGHSRHVVRPYLFRGEVVVLKEYAMASAQHRRMLEREVVAIAKLAHPHIVRLQAVFVDEDGYSHCLKAYVQTQLYAGGTLRSWLERAHDALACDEHGAPSLLGISPRAFVKAAHARVAPMHHLHSHGVVHGDVKLENALVEVRAGVCADAPYTTPLDAWRVRDATPATVVPATTRVGAGTAGYMSPEVLGGAPASLASDVYAFGVCVLTRRSALDGHDGAIACARVVGEPAVRPAASTFSGCAFEAATREAAARDAWRACAVCLDDRSCPTSLTSLNSLCPRPLSLALPDNPLPSKNKNNHNHNHNRIDEQLERHFVCDECLAQHARGSVRCVSSARGAGACAHAYSVTVLARHVPKELDEQHIAAELERGALLQLTEAERRLREVRIHVCERILTLACPRCFSGCSFCAYCLEDCGDNAHAHRHVFEQKQRARRERMLLKFLDEQFPGDADSRDAAVVDVAIDLHVFLSADARGH